MIAEVLLAPLRATKGFLALEEAVERSVGKPAAAFGLVEGARVAVAGALSRGRRTLIVAPSDQAAMRTAEDLTRCGVAAAHFPARETALFRADAESRELIHRRIAVLGDLLQGKVQVVCAPIEALLAAADAGCGVPGGDPDAAAGGRGGPLGPDAPPWLRRATRGRRRSRAAASSRCAAASWTSTPCRR